MKSITVLLLSIILISNVLSCGDDGKSYFPTILHRMMDSLPELQRSVDNMPDCETSELKPTCSKGYSYFSSKREERLFKAIKKNTENTEAFFEILLGGLPIIEEDKEKLMNLMETMRYSGFQDIIALDLLYDRENVQRNKGVYFNILIDKTCGDEKNALDFLYVGIKAQFILNKDVFALEESSKNLFGSRKSKTNYFETNANLSREQYKNLLDYLQLSAFSDAENIVKAFDDQF